MIPLLDGLILLSEIAADMQVQATYNVRDDSVRDQLAVLVPILAVLGSTSLIISDLSVHEKNDKEGQVPVRDGRIESSRKRPR